ncbi:uncharacterized protein COLE_05923 [Cutaneotrichosporon oleaginosum]|uniref:uncharacterized protein n=1 Tax=Cutaneotrichosporon oleaginosum TaxID=879819 RepID=UPI001328E4FF|nr:hypothetical protein COLE_05923 [Cutaneotrichosporon oleaginosum]
MDEFPPERIRNLSIIAHIDHGKSTLADRLLQMTDTLPQEANAQFLDKLKVERERGITVKAQTVSIIHTHTDGNKYLINLIDTPGHVDFSYEVSRSLGACEGGLLLVDCTQGIQAQTLSVFHHAVDANLKLLPVINKVDLQHASPEETKEQIAQTFGLPIEDCMPISAKSGLGVDTVLRQIVDGLPPPKWDGDGKLRALVFDTFYDRFRGVVSLVRIKSGSVKKGDKVRFLQAGKKYEVLEVGIYNPEEVSVGALKEGQVGYLICNMKNSEEAHIGDTVCLLNEPTDPLPGFQPMKAMVYAGVFPMDNSDFPQLEESIERLTLNDRSVSVERESSAALGQGFRLGFLGTLHMDVFRQRLEDEYSSNVIITAPTVPYKVVYQRGKQQVEEFISNPADFPDTTDTRNRVSYVEEPMVNATIFVPTEYVGAMMELCAKYRGIQDEYKFLDNTDRAILKYRLPLAEIVTDFFSELKSSSSGFASFDYEEGGYERSNLVKLNMLLNQKPVDALALIVHKDAAQFIGRQWVKKLKDVLPRQLFELAIQASIGNKVVARESLSAMRKDVTAGLYGGHYERKMKHLNKQKEGKKRLKRLAGNIDIPQTAFFDVLSSRPRTFSTSARQSVSFLEHLPDVPLPPPELAMGAEKVSPIGRHDLSPEQRSALLSVIMSQTSGQLDLTSEALFANFTRLYLASTTNAFTPDELRTIARTIHATDRRFKANMRSANERFETVVNALRETAGNNTEAIRGLELAILVSSSRAQRHVPQPVLRKAESVFMALYPSPPKASEMTGYKMCFNHILYLCAMARSPGRLNAWWSKMIREGVTPDSWSYLSRILVCGGMHNINGVVAELAFTLPKVEGADALVLANTALWMAVRADRWDVAGALHSALSARMADDVTRALSNVALPSSLVEPLTRLAPDRVTSAILVEAHTFRGDLLAALNVLREMFAAGHAPGVPEYMAMFHGFARHGVIGSGPAGDAAAAFPFWHDNHASSGLDNPWGDEEPGHFSSNYRPASLWTQAALEDLFTSFLALPPPRTSRKTLPRAPGANAVYRTLLAFGRVTNSDGRAVRAALNAMMSKFGPGNEEGWVGWHEDKRHKKIRTVLGME